MCGVAGLIAVPGDQRAAGARLLAALRHRGPDDEGLEQPLPHVTLVHTRLAILDLSSNGHQPMADLPPGDLPANWLVYNGEIFNFRALRPALAAHGWPCRTQSDTEVVLHSYRVWDEACVARFRGFFAFCLVDRARGLAQFYRDRLGVKPLYLYRPPQGGLIFASELRALLALGPEYIDRRVSAAALESFLAQGAVQGYAALVDGVTLLEPGARLTVELATGAERVRRRYWQLPVADEPPPLRHKAVEHLSAVLHQAVRLRLLSDVPLGLFLSGGIDSAALLAAASEVSGTALRTLSLGFDVADFDESRAAAATAAAFQSNHTTLRITGAEILAALPGMLAAMDQPTVDGTNTYVVSLAARQAGLTVALSGLGGDELFGGYASFTDVPRALAWRQRFGALPFATWLLKLKRNRTTAKLAEMLSRAPDWLTMYLLRRELFLPDERRALHPAPPGIDPVTGLAADLTDGLRSRAAALDAQNRISLFELELYLRHMLLRDADVFSMAAPIEYRVPLLDHELVEAVFRLPGDWKRPDPRPKPLLLDLIGARLPQAVWRSPKRGFTFPWSAWLGAGGALAETLRDAVYDAAVWRRLNFDPAAVRALWRRFTSGDTSINQAQMLAFVNLRDYVARYSLSAA